MRCILVDLDGALPEQPTLRARLDAGTATLVAARDLASGLRIVAGRPGLDALRCRLAGLLDPARRPPLIFYGSGDFHHLAVVFLAALRECVTLVHIDNHPDWTTFPATVNCGAWVNRALELPTVRRVVTIGPSGSDLRHPEWKFANLEALRRGDLEVHAWRAPPTRFWGRPILASGCTTWSGRLVWHNLADRPWDQAAEALVRRLPTGPIWISLDKDVLTAQDAVTDWDQGGMRLEDVLQLISRMVRRHKLLGMDVCGDHSSPVFRDPFRRLLSRADRPRLPAVDRARAIAVNDRTNGRIIAAMSALSAGRVAAA